MNSNIFWEEKPRTAPCTDNSKPDVALVKPEDDAADVTRIAPEATIPPTEREDVTLVGEPDAHAPLEVGDIVSERYELLELLGEGGMGRVFLANDLVFAVEYKDKNSKVAIKVLNPRFSRHESARLAMQREARKSRALTHPNVVSVHHFDQHGPHAYMIMEYIEGKPLNTWVKDHAGNGLSFEDALPLIEGMAHGLDYIHSEQLVHCDFKPSNVFVTADNSVKVLDLGIARANEGLDGSDNTQDKTEFDAGSLGALTPAFASCEQFERKPPSPSDDVYALACITYLLLTGKHPLNGEKSIVARQLQIRPEPVAELDRRRWLVLERAMAFSREDRIASAGEFIAELKGEQNRGRRLAAAMGIVALLGIASTAIGMYALMEPMNPDIKWMERFKPDPTVARQPLTAAEEGRYQGWFEQGFAYLGIANQEFDKGNIIAAHHVLRGGASNAYWALEQYTSRVDSPEAREGLLDIVESYARWASELQDSKPQEAMWLLCQGMAIHPEHAAFKRLFNQLTGDLGTMPGAITDCTTLVNLGSPPAPLGGNPLSNAQGGAP